MAGARHKFNELEVEMIDINELRRLAQAATPGPWINHGRQPNVAGLPHSAVAAKTLLARVYSEAYGDVEQETANASFIAAANPAAISELLDRLEAAEKDIALKEKLIDALGLGLNAAAHERDNLRAEVESWKGLAQQFGNELDTVRAKIAAMEQQKPARLVTPTAYRWRYRGAVKWQYGELTEEVARLAKEHNHEVQALGILPDAQQCKNCNGMGDRFDPSGEKIPCDLCESHLEEIRSLVAEAAHDIISGSDFWLSISLAAKKIYALPGAQEQEPTRD